MNLRVCLTALDPFDFVDYGWIGHFQLDIAYRLVWYLGHFVCMEYCKDRVTSC